VPFSVNQHVSVLKWSSRRRFASFLAGGLLSILWTTMFLPASRAAENGNVGGAGDAEPTRDAIIEAALRDDFLVLPIRTELQRAAGKKSGNAKVLVLINGVKVIQGEDEAIDAGALKLSKIWEAIEPFAKSEAGNVVFQMWCDTYARAPGDDGSWPASSILLEFLREFGQRIGFQDADVRLFFLTKHSEYHNGWERAVADFAPLPGEQEPEEPGVGDQQVKLYLVRTRLSRLLYRDVDCVIHFVRPIDEIDIPSAVETMKRCLPQLELKKKGKVNFLYHWNDPAISNAVRGELMGKHIYRDMLGFSAGSFTVRN
jgi:hypothetical protein